MTELYKLLSCVLYIHTYTWRLTLYLPTSGGDSRKPRSFRVAARFSRSLAPQHDVYSKLSIIYTLQCVRICVYISISRPRDGERRTRMTCSFSSAHASPARLSVSRCTSRVSRLSLSLLSLLVRSSLYLSSSSTSYKRRSSAFQPGSIGRVRARAVLLR